MITISIDPVIFSIGHFMLRWYSLIVTFAIVVGVWITWREANRKGLAEKYVGDAVLWVIVGGLIGARLFHVIDHWPDEFAPNPVRALYIWEGGLAIWGAVIGGGIALAMARAGEDLDAVAVFHAPLAPKGAPAEPGKVKAKILAQEGGKDPMIPAEQVKAFEEEMKSAGVEARVIVYPEAKHSFTNPNAGKAGMDALAYDPKADKESWKAAMDFFGKALGK